MVILYIRPLFVAYNVSSEDYLSNSQIYSYVPIINKKSRSWAYYEPIFSPISDY